MKQSSYTGQNWGRSQSTLTTGTLPMRRYRTGSWFEAKGLYAPGSERIPAMAWVYSIVFIVIALGVLVVGAKVGL
jgi:hypothetical protein